MKTNTNPTTDHRHRWNGGSVLKRCGHKSVREGTPHLHSTCSKCGEWNPQSHYSGSMFQDTIDRLVEVESK